MSKKKGSLIDSIKNQIKNSGANKGKFLYFKEGAKRRIRFLQDMDEGMKVLFHSHYERSIQVPCQELFDRECGYCDDEELRHRDLYMWSVYDYESKEVLIMLEAVNNCSPIPALMGMYDTYGTVTDRDYVITQQGKGTNKSFSVVPMDKAKFRNEKAKPFSESKMLALLDKAYPDTEKADEDDDDEPKKKKRRQEEDEDDEPKKKRKRSTDDDDDDEEEEPKKKSKRKVEEDDEEEDDDEEVDYEDMSAVELYKLCVKRGLKVKPKKDEDYYIEKLEELDEEEDDEDDEDWDE